MSARRTSAIRLVGLLAAALWWGSLSATAFWVVPGLFRHLPTPALAGNMAGQLFSAQNAVAAACGLALLGVFWSFWRDAARKWTWGALILVVLGLSFAAISEWVVAPHILARDNLPLWHGLGSLLYLGQWLCALGTLVALGRPGWQSPNA
jgi:hypothetical protein